MVKSRALRWIGRSLLLIFLAWLMWDVSGGFLPIFIIYCCYFIWKIYDTYKD